MLKSKTTVPHEPRIYRTAPETGMVRSRALQRGRGAVPQCPEVRAEALYYEPLKVHGPNARQKGVEATYEPVDAASPFTFVLSPDAGARKFQCACPRGVLSSPHRGRGRVRRIRFLDSIRDKFVVQSLPSRERKQVAIAGPKFPCPCRSTQRLSTGDERLARPYHPTGNPQSRSTVTSRTHPSPHRHRGYRWTDWYPGCRPARRGRRARYS